MIRLPRYAQRRKTSGRHAQVGRITLGPELGWQYVSAGVVLTVVSADVSPIAPHGLALWEGELHFAQTPQADQYRLLIEEHELIATDPARATAPDAGPERLIFAETISLDASLPLRH